MCAGGGGGGGGSAIALQCVGVGGGGGAGRIAICDKAKYWCVSGMSALQSQGSVFGGVGGWGGIGDSSSVCRGGERWGDSNLCQGRVLVCFSLCSQLGGRGGIYARDDER